ncbi:hypothetical protein MCOR07_005023 [Pyricularia oryzae]|nr:hypothetical protein MCOR19_008485 [Pyricularia oryzae]KAI6271065.1 hypothetical protein MCOR26_007965 [Pyricularia oryzae]KAI6315639.1 hypothetical protein MCOR29_006890 [Pyricularia oryzae]KAI6338380.1 hypothetical protein MCOR30_003045 [Pyricularia oryzae]KAI6340499.1 hypothetical protein MCOR28_006537 [Pyricularia oryzae]
MESVKKTYNDQYEKWVPWLEDMFLSYFTKDNKASYTAKDNLSKTKVTGVKQVDTLQDGINNTVGDQLGQDGLARPVGDIVSKEGLNRFERKGKGEDGNYDATGVTGKLSEGGSAVAGGVVDGGKAVGSAVGGLLGGGNAKKVDQK